VPKKESGAKLCGGEFNFFISNGFASVGEGERQVPTLSDKTATGSQNCLSVNLKALTH